MLLPQICVLNFSLVKPLSLRQDKFDVGAFLTGTYKILILLRTSLLTIFLLNTMNTHLLESFPPLHNWTIMSWYKTFGTDLVFLKYTLKMCSTLISQATFDTLAYRFSASHLSPPFEIFSLVMFALTRYIYMFVYSTHTG